MGAAELSFVVKAIDQASGRLTMCAGKWAGCRQGGQARRAARRACVGAASAVAGIGALGAVLGQSVKEAQRRRRYRRS